MKPKTPHKGETARGTRRGWAFWLAGALILSVIGGIALTVHRTGKTTATAARSPGPETSQEIASSSQGRLLGRWLRPDGGYILTIRGIEAGGRVDATYDNPRPIHVAKAQAKCRGSELSLYVELRDRNYPGNYYTLSYNAGTDQLVGVYHHLGLNQEFDVNFVRLR